MPTRDIHMRQVGMQDEWLDFLENYVQPLQEAAFTGYASEVGVFASRSTCARAERTPRRDQNKNYNFLYIFSASTRNNEFHGQIPSG